MDEHDRKLGVGQRVDRPGFRPRYFGRVLRPGAQDSNSALDQRIRRFNDIEERPYHCDFDGPSRFSGRFGHSPGRRATRYLVETPNVEYSTYVDDNFPNRLFFGDTHLHMSWSTDAGMVGATLGPDAAYRVSRGGEVTSHLGWL